MKKKKSVLGVVFTNIGGLLLFLIAFGIANIFLSDTSNQFIWHVLDFLNTNIWLIIKFSIYFFFAELFYVFIFPFNLPYPIFNAIGGYFLVLFLFSIFVKIEEVTGGEFSPLVSLDRFVGVLVFIIVLIVGYVKIITPEKKPVKEEEPKDIKMKKQDRTEWRDIGEEFKLMVMDIIKSIRRTLQKK